MKVKSKRLLLAILCVTFALSVTAFAAGCNKCDHSYGSWVTEQAATCTVDGLETRTCSKCSNKDTRTIKASHDSSIYCSACGKTFVSQDFVSKFNASADVLTDGKGVNMSVSPITTVTKVQYEEVWKTFEVSVETVNAFFGSDSNGRVLFTAEIKSIYNEYDGETVDASKLQTSNEFWGRIALTSLETTEETVGGGTTVAYVCALTKDLTDKDATYETNLVGSYPLENLLGGIAGSIVDDEQTIAQITQIITAIEAKAPQFTNFIKTDLKEFVDGISSALADEIYQATVKTLNFFFDLSKTDDGGYVLSKKDDLLTSIATDLETLSLYELADKYIEKGILDKIAAIDLIKISALKVSDVVDYLAEIGITVEKLETLANDFKEIVDLTENVTKLKGWIEANKDKAVVAVINEVAGETVIDLTMIATVSATLKQIPEMAKNLYFYDLIFPLDGLYSQDADAIPPTESVKALVRSVCIVLDQTFDYTIVTDDKGAIKEISFSIDYAKLSDLADLLGEENSWAATFKDTVSCNAPFEMKISFGEQKVAFDFEQLFSDMQTYTSEEAEAA